MSDDTVSRKAVIDAVHTATYGFICGAEDGDEMTEADKLVLSINKAVGTAIKALPTAQPESCNKLATDCIDRQDAIDAHCELCGDRGKCSDICPDVEVFKLLPSVQPEIIRCKDCKYCDSYIAEITSDGNMERIEYRCKDFHASVMPDEYCSRGERRDV